MDAHCKPAKTLQSCGEIAMTTREGLHCALDYIMDRQMLRRALDAVEFKEAEHSRAPDGKFGSKGAAAMPKGMENVTKGSHKQPHSFCSELLKTGKYSDADIAQAAQTLFGSKTSLAAIHWYKKKNALATPAGKAAAAQLKTGIKSNATAIKAATANPVPLEQLSAAIDAQAAKSCQTVFVAAYDVHDALSKKVFIKLSGVPDGLDKQEWGGAGA